MMNQYDFLNLSYVEFEELCRDLLQCEWQVRLESFSEGKDGGIDLRYLRTKKKQLIVQCKRYSDYNALSKALKKELSRLAGFKNTAYYITTSVSLTDNQKQKIIALLYPYLGNQSRIIAKKDINALLRKYPQVEKSHFKLWIQSTAMLESILRSKVVNQSAFEMEQIRSLMKRYVVNPSFEQAETILEQKRFVVISGIPGIGKTTLARVLAFMYLSRKKYQEFVYLSNSIDEGYDLYKEDTKQVFLFDDFLGQSFADRTLTRNEDRRIIEFIRKISKSKNKILLFTTREYILQDVQLKHDLLMDPEIDFAKCLIDLSSYTNWIKAKILYNHLYFSGLPTSHLKIFAKKTVYTKIIRHQNYSPRIIETLISQELSAISAPDQFVQNIIDSLNSPFKIWEAPFTKQINNLSRWLLTILLTMGTPVIIEDLFKACKRFAEKNGDIHFKGFTLALFNQSIKELENSFLISKKDKKNVRILEFQNPSVRDFLLHYFELNKDQLLPVIQAAIFQEQLFNLFTTKPSDNDEVEFILKSRKIVQDNTLSEAILEKATKEGALLESCRVSGYRNEVSQEIEYRRFESGQFRFLNSLHDRFIETNYEDLADAYVSHRLKETLSWSPSKKYVEGLEDYIQLLKKYHQRLPVDPGNVIKEVSESFHYLYQYQYYFTGLKEIFPDEFQDYILQESFYDKINEIAQKEIKQVKAEKIDDLVHSLESIQNDYDIDFSEEINDLSPDEEDEDLPEEEIAHYDYMEDKERSEPDEIEAIFSSFGSMD